MRGPILAVTLCVGACGGRGGGDDDDDGDGEQACLEIADTGANVAVRCAAGT